MKRATSLLIAGALFASGLAVISLTPFNGWRYVPEPPWSYLAQPWPRYWTGLDVLVNLLAYIPLGVLLCLGFSQRMRRGPWNSFAAFLLACFAGLTLSMVLEALQTYIPSRRPSILDVISNLGGTAAGAFIAGAYAQNRQKPMVADNRPIEIGALMILVLWLLAQAAPQEIWLALGDVIAHSGEIFSSQRILAEALCVTSAILACALIVHLALLESSRWLPGYQPSHWFSTLVVLMLVTLGVRAVSIFLLHSPEALWVWLGPGTQAGLVLALLTAYGLSGLKPSQQKTVAVAALLTTVLLTNTLPENQYASQAFSGWSSGPWLNLRGLANFAAIAWPFAALLWLLFALNRQAIGQLDRR
jgi:VanZ family protein